MIATREAVFESKPVEREVFIFTNRGRHCIPIFFGDTFTAEEKANPGKYIVLDRLPDDTLYIEDKIENLPISPSTKTVEKLVDAYTITSRRKLRTKITLITLSSLILLTMFTSFSCINARMQEKKARISEVNSSALLAESLTDSGQAEVGTRLALNLIEKTKGKWATDEIIERAQNALQKAVTAQRGLLVLRGNDDGVGASASFDPSGTRVVTTSYDDKARIWDAQSGKQLFTLLHHDEKREWGLDMMSATGASDKQKKIDKFRAEPRKNKQTVLIVDVDTDTRKEWTIAMFNDERQFVKEEFINDISELAKELNKEEKDKDRIIKLATSFLGLSLSKIHVREAIFDPSGKFIVTIAAESAYVHYEKYYGQAYLWDARTGKRLRKLDHGKSVLHACFDQNGERLALTARDGLYIWDLESWEKQYLGLRGKVGSPLVTRFDESGLMIFFSDNTYTLFKRNNTLLKLDQNYEEVKEVSLELDYLECNDEYMNFRSIDFDSVGLRVAATCENKVFIWSTESGKLERVFKIKEFRAHSVAFCPSGHMLAVTSSPGAEEVNGVTHIFDSFTGEELLVLQGHSTSDEGHEIVSSVNSATFDPFGERLITTGADQTVRIWDMQNVVQNSPNFSYQRGEYIRGGTLAPDERTIALIVEIEGEFEVRIIDLSTKTDRFRIRTQGDIFPMAVAFDLEGKRLMVARGNTLTLWDVVTGQTLLDLPCDSNVKAASFVPSGKRVISLTGGKNTILTAWDSKTGDEFWTFLHESPVSISNFNQSGSRLVTVFGKDRNQVRVWDLETDNEPIQFSHEHPVHKAFFPSTIDRVVTISESGGTVVRIWDPKNGALLSTLPHKGIVQDLELDPSATMLLTVSIVKLNLNMISVRVWDLTSGKEISKPWYIKPDDINSYGQRKALKAIVHAWDKIGKELSAFDDSEPNNYNERKWSSFGPDREPVVTLLDYSHYNLKRLCGDCGGKNWSTDCLSKRIDYSQDHGHQAYREVLEVLPQDEIEITLKESEMIVKDLKSGQLVWQNQHNDRREQWPHWYTLRDSVRDRFLTIESNDSGEAIGRMWRLPPWRNIEEMIAHAKRIVRPELNDLEKRWLSLEVED